MFDYRSCNTLYVSPDGKGNGKNYHENEAGCGPLGSIGAALKFIEQMRGSGLLQPITVKLLAGEYLLNDAIYLRATMSNVTFEPFGNGPVLISGGKRITGFEKTTFNGVPCFGAYVKEIADGAWRFTDLYVDGLRAEYTRLPEGGVFRMKATENIGDSIFSPSYWFTAADEDIALFQSLHAFEDCIISFNHYWIDEHTPVKSIDRETGRINMEYRSRFTIRPGQDYILENVAEAFKNPGEWYCDRAAGMVYFIPRDDDMTPDSIEVWAPVSTYLVNIQGGENDHVTGIHFRDIKFAYTRGDYGSKMGTNGEAQTEYCASDSQAVANMDGVINVSYAHNVSFENCTLTCIGRHGINVGNGCRSVKIESCTVYDGAAGGVRICGGAYGAPESQMTRQCSVTDCKITHVGRRYLSACGVLIMHASEIDVIHNEIGDLYYTGVSCGWVWGYAKTVTRDNRIMYNHIYDLGKGKLSDMGGVYLLGSQPGTVVSGNRIHDIRCKEYGGWALYTDEGSAGILLENNLCYRTSSNSYHQHYGTSNVVRNNIFADSDDTLLKITRPEAHLNIMFTGNILYSTGKPIIAPYPTSGFEGLHTLSDGSVESYRNLMWCSAGDVCYCAGENLKTLADAQAAGLEAESVIADPLFADPANDDYTLADNSPAFAMGFRPFDWKKAGVRK
ncbi:MAG: right-handed parallel beta-helix repeat-containing protein [Clostridia bacterium]|nr:right-handed parallel beta-helix repeat-containing protein [Clostridia bacterium]